MANCITAAGGVLSGSARETGQQEKTIKIKIKVLFFETGVKFKYKPLTKAKADWQLRPL